jgi:hypothetical protein
MLTLTLLYCVITGHSQSLTANLLYYLPIMSNANDVSGNGYHATPVNATLVADRNGNPNSAYELTGATSGHILLANAAPLHPPLPMSVSFWARFDALAKTAFSNNFMPTAYSGMWMGVGADGKINLNYGDGGSINPAFRRSKNSATNAGAGAWHHYVGVIRGQNDMDIYIDCVDAGGAYSGTGGSLFYNNDPGILGASATVGGAVYMIGRLDEIAFWDRALTSYDITRICNGELDKLVIAREDALSETIDLFPNPVSSTQGQVKVILPHGLQAMETVQFMDVKGRVLKTVRLGSGHEHWISTAGMASGVYFVRFTGVEGQTIVQRLQVL